MRVNSRRDIKQHRVGLWLDEESLKRLRKLEQVLARGPSDVFRFALKQYYERAESVEWDLTPSGEFRK